MSIFDAFSYRVTGGAAMLCAMAAPAPAQTRELTRAEAWSAFAARTSDMGVPLCALRTDLPGSRVLWLSKVQGRPAGSGLATRPTWRVPPGARVAVRVQIDGHPAVEAVASPPPNSERGLVWVIPAAAWKAWLEQAAEATSLRVWFPQGDEPEWRFRVDGLGAVLPVFNECVRRIDEGDSMGLPAPTQPFGLSGPPRPTPPAQSPPSPVAPQRALKIRLDAQ
jgi:hypothetical protein